MDPRGATVYLVEDSTIICRLLTELIEAAGAKVVGQAATASEAIADIVEVRPHAIIVDVRLREGTGFDVLEAVAINSDGEPPRRIVLTNFATDPYRIAARQLGVDHFFDKATDMREAVALAASMESTAGDSHNAMAA